MAEFTMLGSGIWDWKPWTDLPLKGRMVYLALYTSPAAKRIVPGLFHGDLAGIAFSSKLPAQDARDGLEELIQAGLAQWDRAENIIRLTQLPDAAERPNSHKALRGFWNRFQTVRPSAIRDSHVALIRWMADNGPNELTEVYEKTWEETFGTVSERAKRRRGVRTVASGTHSSPAQVDLFVPAQLPDAPEGYRYPSPRGMDQDQDQVSLGLGSGDYPVAVAEDVPLAPVLPMAPRPSPPAPRAAGMLFTVRQLLETLESGSGGKFRVGVFDDRLAKPLTEAIKACGRAGVDLAAIGEIAGWLASGGLGWRKDALGPAWAAKTGELLDALNQARASPPAARTTASGGGSRRPEPSPRAAFQAGGGFRKL